jgi:hypothetical protein
MKTGMGLALIAVGAILAFAVTTNTSVFNLHTAGYVLMIIGIIGIAIPRSGYARVGRRVFTRQAQWRPRARVEEVSYPTYVSRNPAGTRVQAGLPAPASPETASPVEETRDVSTTQDLTTEVRPVGGHKVTEDVYDEEAL